MNPDKFTNGTVYQAGFHFPLPCFRIVRHDVQFDEPTRRVLSSLLRYRLKLLRFGVSKFPIISNVQTS